ncbi:MAG: hypothetical protein QN152_09280 [Armatimonadota bacterium]|nr:hypothetical protein [Armatimonadota bacterium]MDR7427783.1 hypothetical protein [Armatimonadota bacterium]MDR7464028.1 hypothetical protein [Armatimonadota bacterium]MDR7468913.1 hypothetical protein [Armatimonadota bacterium]MDR7474846.1 hypothetical protein [Armatimonadota bacterium]
MGYRRGQEIRAWLVAEAQQWQDLWFIKRIDTTDLQQSRRVFRGTKFAPQTSWTLMVALKAWDDAAPGTALGEITEALKRGGMQDPEGRVVTRSMAWDW